MSDIAEKLRRKVFHGPTMEAVHTKTIEWQAADEIDTLRNRVKELEEALKPFAHCVFNDNGDVTISGVPTFDEYFNARAVLEKS